LGEQLAGLGELAGTRVEAEAAVLYDWDNLWALNDAAGPRNDGLKNYREDCLSHYYQLWRRAIAADVVDHRGNFGRYKLLVAPMLYMVREDTAKRIGDFVSSGGTFICTYWSGIVDQNDLCYLGGFPGPLRGLLGIWVEEIDAFYGAVIEEAGLRSVWPDPLPEGISATRRVGEGATYTLVMNFKEVEQELTLPQSLRKATILVGKANGTRLMLEAFGYAVLRNK
jgi:beta-galactosidase GanA